MEGHPDRNSKFPLKQGRQEGLSDNVACAIHILIQLQIKVGTGKPKESAEYLSPEEEITVTKEWLLSIRYVGE